MPGTPTSPPMPMKHNPPIRPPAAPSTGGNQRGERNMPPASRPIANADHRVGERREAERRLEEDVVAESGREAGERTRFGS